MIFRVRIKQFKMKAKANQYHEKSIKGNNR